MAGMLRRRVGPGWRLLCVLICAWNASPATGGADQPEGQASDSERSLFPAALLEVSERSQAALVAEVGTWWGRWSVPTPVSETGGAEAGEALEGVAKSAGYVVRQTDGWWVARHKQWFWVPRLDCDSSAVLRIFQDGGITAATVPEVAAMSQRQRRTLTYWLGGRGAAPTAAPYHELMDIEDNQAVTALEMWATLTPGQLEAAFSSGLHAADLLPHQAAVLSQLLWNTAGVRWSPESASDVVLRIGPRIMSRYDLHLLEPPNRHRNEAAIALSAAGSAEGRRALDLPGSPSRHRNEATIALSAAGFVDGRRIEVPLPIADAVTMAQRRRQAAGFLVTDFGRIRSLWPQKEERTGLTTPFDFRCAIVKVKDVLLHITRECGVHLKADDWSGKRYLLARFRGRTVDEFRAALAELLNCKWRHDEEDDYWLLYQDEEAREEEAQLIAQQEAQERARWEERIADNPMGGMVKDILSELDPDMAQRIRDGLPVDVPLSGVPRGLWPAIASCALFRTDVIGERRISATGFDLSADDLAAGWLEFRRSRSGDVVRLTAVLEFEGGDRAAGTYRHVAARTSLGPVFSVAD